ncbi:MAG: hypothetical protein DRQ60_00965 [Gammaproteobacteria bacterium]|nr:MAG: hypothetical protein DRQ52_06075 [Gammaproteobacteria bacterium]RLA17847.1 MAG: hypothetical protein DRQ60_00965 [Gammaproteobacteria bacterium]
MYSMTSPAPSLAVLRRLSVVAILCLPLWSCTSATPPVAEAEPSPVEPVVPAAEALLPPVIVPVAEREGQLQRMMQMPVPVVDSRYSFHAVGVPVADALRLFARDNRLNLVLDRQLEGKVTVDFTDLRLKQALDAILDAFDYGWEINNGLIRVRREITRSFDVDYLRLIRSSDSENQSGEFGISGGSDSSESSAANEFSVEQENKIDFWEELLEELGQLVGEEGRVVANRTAGFVSVTAGKRAVQDIENYLHRVKLGSMRQVSIQVEIVEVELTDNTQLGIDWVAPDLLSIGRFDLGKNALSGATQILGGGGPGTLFHVSVDGDTRAIVKALQRQGDLHVVSQPRLKAINNQTAQIRVAQDEPYYVLTEGAVPSSSQNAGQGATFEQRSATIGLVMQVTPHISANGWITLEISPVITKKVGLVPTPFTDKDGNIVLDKDFGPPIVDVKQTTVVARVRSGETAVIGGLIQDVDRETVDSVPVLGDLPLIGAAFRDTVTEKARTELVIMITPVAEYIEVEEEQYAW